MLSMTTSIWLAAERDWKSLLEAVGRASAQADAVPVLALISHYSTTTRPLNAVGHKLEG